MLEYNQIKPRKYIVFNDEPYEVIDSHVFRKQQRKPVNATKLKNLISGKVVEHSFHQSDKVAEAEIESRDIKYLYTNQGEYWFCEAGDPSKRFSLPTDLLGAKIKFVKPNSLMTALSFGDQIINVAVPIKVELRVTEAPPAVRGNTAVGATKQITLETGATVNAPLFINTGDVVRINTETGEYVERARQD
ncbi:MAG: elongation factor P [Candidatus Paceibacterota bacterium]